jgi:nucleotidyltransferase/DNA polymerase involved in DNA repair
MFACIYIPDFPVAAIIRAEPILRERAVAVLDGKPPQVRVVALNDKSRLLGMDIGMTKVQAAIFAIPQQEFQSFSKTALAAEELTENLAEESSSSGKADRKKKAPQIEITTPLSRKAQPALALAILRQRSIAQEESSHAALLDVAHAFTPRVENTSPGRLLLDLDGLERLYGPHPVMARELASRVNTLGLDANIGIAANPDAAMHAACGFSGVTLIPAGEEARRLGVLTINVLLDSFEITRGNASENSDAKREREKLREKMLDTLERWGVRDFRTLALLPEHALAARLGEAGTHLQYLARGATMRTLALCEPSVRFEEAMEMESPVETLEPLSFVLNRLLDQLCARLEARALAIQELTLRLQLEPRVGDEQAITLEELTSAQSQGMTNSKSVILSEAIPRSRRAEPKSRRFAGGAGSRDSERAERVEEDPYPAFKAFSVPSQSCSDGDAFVGRGASPSGASSRDPLSMDSRSPQSRSDGDAFVGRGASPCKAVPNNLQAAERPTPNLYIRTLRLPVSMRDPKVFLKLLQLDLSAHPPGAPVCKLWISAEPAPPRSAQGSLFLPVTPEAEKLEITLARIAGVVGERRAGIAKLLDTHRPDAFCMERFASQPVSQSHGAATLSEQAIEAPLALRIFRPAQQLRVQMTDGRPCKLMLTVRNEDQDLLQGTVLWTAGPWRSSGDWWTQQHSSTHISNEDIQVWDREEWDIALASEKSSGVVLYRIYRNIATGDWFADASYD